MLPARGVGLAVTGQETDQVVQQRDRLQAVEPRPVIHRFTVKDLMAVELVPRRPTTLGGNPLASFFRGVDGQLEAGPGTPIAAVAGGRPALGENRPPAGFSDLRLLRNL